MRSNRAGTAILRHRVTVLAAGCEVGRRPQVLDADNVQIHGADRLDFLRGRLRAGALTLRERLLLADEFTAYGLPDEALPVIAGLRHDVANASALRFLERLVRVNGYLAGIANPVTERSAPERHARLLGPASSFWPSPTAPDRLLVVLATAYNNFYVSFPVLHGILARHDRSILYVKNPGRGMYAGGSPGLGGSIDAMARGLARFAAARGIADVRVCGFSSGGYAALHVAGVLKASSFLGFGAKTDWSAGSPLKVVAGRAAPSVEDRMGNTLVNLAGSAAMAGIGEAVLYHGALDPSDTAHARNMAGLANFTIVPVAGASHNVIQHLMAQGRFDGILAQFLGAAAA